MKTKTLFALLMLIFFSTNKTNAQCHVDAGPNRTFCCPGEQDTLRATYNDSCSCTNKVYQWTPSTGLSNPNVLNPIVTAGSVSKYKLCVTAYKNKGCFTVCCQVCDSVMVTVTSGCCKLMGVPNVSGQSSLVKVFPNPAKNNIQIEVTQEIKSASVSIYDNTGKLVWQKLNTETKKFDVNVSSFPRGIYFIKVADETKEIYSTKIILE